VPLNLDQRLAGRLGHMPVRVINLSGLQGSQNLGVAAYPLVLGHRAIRRPLGLPADRTGRRCGCEIPGLQLGRAGCWGTQPARGIAGEAMNPAERVARRLDAAQQRHTPTAFVVGVVKKSPMTTAGLWPPPWLIPPLSRFSRCCWCSSRFSVSSRPTTRRCGLATIWVCTGLAQTGLFTMQQVWNLPGPARPGYFPRLGRCLLFLVTMGVGLVVTTGVTSLGVFTNQGAIWTILLDIVAAIANGMMFLLVFRVLTPKGVPTSNLVWGAAAGGVAWAVMQALGTFLVGHYLHNDRSVYGVFAAVLGLVTWVYILVDITVYAAEINVVLTRRLWPRAIVQPPLTEADRAVMAAQALQNQRREERQVQVTYNDRPAGAEGSATAPRTVQILRSLLGQPSTTFRGNYFQLQDAPSQPAPVQDRLPLLVGGGGEQRTLRVAARYADHWNSWTTPEVLAHKVSVLQGHCQQASRDPDEIHVSTQALLYLSTDKEWLKEKRQARPGQPVIAGTPAK
jgi:hypothetical protein